MLPCHVMPHSSHDSSLVLEQAEKVRIETRKEQETSDKKQHTALARGKRRVRPIPSHPNPAVLENANQSTDRHLMPEGKQSPDYEKDAPVFRSVPVIPLAYRENNQQK